MSNFCALKMVNTLPLKHHSRYTNKGCMYVFEATELSVSTDLRNNL